MDYENAKQMNVPVQGTAKEYRDGSLGQSLRQREQIGGSYSGSGSQAAYAGESSGIAYTQPHQMLRQRAHELRMQADALDRLANALPCNITDTHAIEAFLTMFHAARY